MKETTARSAAAGAEETQNTAAIQPVEPRAARQTAPTLNNQPPADTRRPEAGIYPGTGTLITRANSPRATAVTATGDFILNFENADVREVVKAVLGDLLKLNYVVDPSVQGVVTIKTSLPVDRAQILPALEEALRLNNLALVEANGVYKVLPSQDAPRQPGAVDRGGGIPAPGFGVEIVPLRFIGAREIQRVLEPLSPVGSILQIDPSRNLVLIGGSETERAALIEDIRTFDVDWLSGMSFALWPLKVADARNVAQELQQVIGGQEGALAGLVRIIPIERMNAVLAISEQPRYLNELQAWIDRLDRANETIDRRIFVYYVQNGRAADLAGVLTRVLTGETSRSAMSGQAHPLSDASAAVPAVPYTPTPMTQPGGAGLSQTISPMPGVGVSNAPQAETGSLIPGRSSNTLRITADETNNAILIYATSREFAIVQEALSKLDIVPLQVMLEAAIAEVTLTKELSYGVQYFFQSRSGRNTVVRTDSASQVIAPKLPGFAYLFSSGSDIRVILSALSSITSVNVVSSPQLFVLNNQTATLQVGDQVPIATQSAVAVQNPGAPIVNTIEFRDTGVILKVTPRVNDGGLVLLDISQEVSDVTTTTTSNIDSPTIQQRKISSSVAIHDGQTIALGGLIKDSKNKTKNGIPFLSDIPVLGGALFGSTDNTTTRTELLVLITPHVVENQQKARSVTEELQRRLKATRPLFERTQ